MAYVNVPKDLSKVKTKVMFNLTKRQLVCFGQRRSDRRPAVLSAERLRQYQYGLAVHGAGHAALFHAGNLREERPAP